MKNGYNRYQVDDTINKLEEELAQLKRLNEAYRLQSEEDKAKYTQLNEKYVTLLNEVAIKEKAANDIAQIALKEANEIIHAANMNADTIIKEALTSAKEVLVDISKLGIEAKEIKMNMNEQLKALSDAIESFDVPPIPNPDLLNK